MLNLFVTAVEEALPLCLVIAILLASRAYAPMERKRLSQITSVVLGAGTILAAIVAYLRLETSVINIPTFDAWVGPLTILSMIVFLVAVWVFGDRDLHDIHQTGRHRFLTVTSLIAMFWVAILFAFPYFFMTDGIVVMGSSIFETQSLLHLTGFVLGTSIVILASWAYVRSAALVPWWLRSLITVAVFAAIAVPRAILLYQQFINRGVFPRSETVFRAVLWVQNNENLMLIVLAVLIVIPALFALITRTRGGGTNPAEVRLVKKDGITRRNFVGVSAVAAGVFVWTLTEGRARADYVPELSAIEPSTIVGDSVLVSRELVSDGHLHRFGYQLENGTLIRFIVIKKNEVAFGTGLDACEICGESGYYEDNGKVICRECDVMMNIQTIGFPGGCNPIPIAYELSADSLAFSIAELESHEAIFA